MAGIVFFFEENDVDIFSGRRLDLAAWNYAIQSAGDITKVIIVNRTAQRIGCFNSGLELFEVVADLPELTGHKTYVVCPWDSAEPKTPLWSFDHETDWYLFGPADGWKMYESMDASITVPMAGRGALHSVHVATTVMLHRYGVKTWQRQS